MIGSSVIGFFIISPHLTARLIIAFNVLSSLLIVSGLTVRVDL